jgi:hypothetical protein
MTLHMASLDSRILYKWQSYEGITWTCLNLVWSPLQREGPPGRSCQDSTMAFRSDFCCFRKLYSVDYKSLKYMEYKDTLYFLLMFNLIFVYI